MKVPPKRKGNFGILGSEYAVFTLNESPSEKEGKWTHDGEPLAVLLFPSMKVPPKRKGNFHLHACATPPSSLNESPSEKEGKCSTR